MTSFFAGATAVTAAAIGLFFLRFWRTTRDRFFIMFAIAFWVFAVDRTLLAALDKASDYTTEVYLLRLAGFVVIIAAIVLKNRER